MVVSQPVTSARPSGLRSPLPATPPPTAGAACRHRVRDACRTAARLRSMRRRRAARPVPGGAGPVRCPSKCRWAWSVEEEPARQPSVCQPALRRPPVRGRCDAAVAVRSGSLLRGTGAAPSAERRQMQGCLVPVSASCDRTAPGLTTSDRGRASPTASTSRPGPPGLWPSLQRHRRWPTQMR